MQHIRHTDKSMFNVERMIGALTLRVGMHSGKYGGSGKRVWKLLHVSKGWFLRPCGINVELFGR